MGPWSAPKGQIGSHCGLFRLSLGSVLSHEIAPQWADQLQGPQGLIWHFGAETDLLNLQRSFLIYTPLYSSNTSGRIRRIRRQY